MSSANSGAGIFALVADAGFVGWTVRVDGTLVFALNVGVALKSRETDTGSSLIPLSAFCIDSTWRRVAGVNDLWPDGSRWRSSALAEGVTNVALVADADWYMVADAAVGIDSTETRTGVLALATDASLVRGAVRVDHTLRTAVRRGPNHFRQTGTLASVSNHSWGVAVSSTRVGITWVHIYWLDC